jgi:uncharacterized protein (DUF1778 family)
MVAERIEVRLDPERRTRLQELAAEAGTPVSDVLRALIDKAWQEAWRTRMLRAIEEISQLNIEDVPDPDELSRQLDETYALPDLD